MLPDRYRELLTAYVDGELSRSDRRRVVRLLRRSEEARALLKQLRHDSGHLKQLPRPTLAADFSASVLQAIAERKLQPGRKRLPVPVARPMAAPAHIPAWYGLAAAASVLGIICLASYAYFSAALQLVGPGSVAIHQPPRDNSPSHLNQPENKPDQANTTNTLVNLPQTPAPEKPIEQNPPTVEGPVVQVPPESKTPAINPMANDPMNADPASGTILTDRFMDRYDLQLVDTALPVGFSLLDLGKDKVQNRLLAELKKDTSFHLDLPCQDSSKAFKRLQTVAKNLKIGLILEQGVQTRLENASFARSTFAVYLDGLTPQDLVRLLDQLGVEERKLRGKKQPEPQFDPLVVLRMTRNERKDLSELFGGDLSKPLGPLGTSLHRPIAEQTANQVHALAGQGGTRPDSWGLVIPYPTGRLSRNTQEVKVYLDTRKPAAPGTLQALLVLRAN